MAQIVSKDQNAVKRLTWAIASINVHLNELRDFWAKTVGVSGSQWLIMLAVADLDQEGEGVAVNLVSKKLHVEPSFVTTQSKQLEKKGFLRRRSSIKDARIVQMSLTDKSHKHFAKLASQQEALNAFIFTDFDDKQLCDLVGKLMSLQDRLKRASLKVIADL